MSERKRYPRQGCAVPFCRRTSTLFDASGFLCADHWRLVDRGLKRFRSKRLRQLAREWGRASAAPDMGESAARIARRWHLVERATWRRMKAQAIERAAMQ